MDKKFGFETFNDEIFQTNVKTKLKSKLFIGDFQSKRLCESLKCYRDVIVIEKKSEIEMCNDFDSFLNDVIEPTRGRGVFVGITKHEEHYSIWTELDEELAFGKYWFQVRTFSSYKSDDAFLIDSIPSIQQLYIYV